MSLQKKTHDFVTIGGRIKTPPLNYKNMIWSIAYGIIINFAITYGTLFTTLNNSIHQVQICNREINLRMRYI